jgi:glucokinase
MPAESVTLEDAKRPLFAGVDVGGTSIKLGLVDDLGRSLAYSSFPTRAEENPESGIRRTAEALHQMLASAQLEPNDLAAIGLGTPGTMDIPKGMILEPPNMPGWRNFPVRDALSQAMRKPVTYANDAGAAAFGEFWVGSGRQHDSIVMLTLGTGVGGGIIIDGKSIDGHNSHGSECGHIIIDSRPSARVCGCGRTGHLEAYASATALVKRTAEAIQSGRVSSLSNAMLKGQDLSGKLIWEAAQAGDALATEMILETADHLAIGISILAQIIDPAAFIIGGAMNFGGEANRVGKAFIDRLRNTAKPLLFPAQSRHLMIEFAALGSDAGFVGAAGLARAEFAKK